MKNHLLILSFLLLLSCGKKTTMKGRIVNPVTNTGIACIKVIETKPKKNTVPSDYKSILKLESGIYFLYYQANQGHKLTKKIIIL